MSERIRKAPSLAAACVLAVFLVVGLLSFAGPCVHEDGSQSACAIASQALLAEGGAALIAALVGAIAGNAKIRAACAAIVACAGIAALATPGGLLPLCMMQTMRCWTLMRPFAMICGAALCLTGLIAVVRALRAQRR